MSRWIIAVGIGLCLSVGLPVRAQSPKPTLSALATGDQRAPDQIERNEYRHPVETLEWFGLKPDMTVVEIWPSGGWYAGIIAPYVANQGQYYGAVHSLGQW